jgi:hypothetical protein
MDKLFQYSASRINAGTARETFLFNQLRQGYPVAYTDKGDFLVANKFTIEAGGKQKSLKQIADVENAFIAADNIEFASRNKIPLWLFGFLY